MTLIILDSSENSALKNLSYIQDILESFPHNSQLQTLSNCL
jgi:GNAT superfamily N-acetyltransferase